MKNTPPVVIEKATIKDMAKVAEVHVQCFHGYFISELGTTLIQRYYQEFLLEDDNLFLIAKENENIIGFCMGYVQGKSDARNSFIRNNRFLLTVKILEKGLQFNKIVINRVYLHVKYYFKALFNSTKNISPKQLVDAKGDLLSIGVLEQYRGLGVSCQLVRKFEEMLMNKEINTYQLSCYSSNLVAIKFYQKMGLVPIRISNIETVFEKVLQE